MGTEVGRCFSARSPSGGAQRRCPLPPLLFAWLGLIRAADSTSKRGKLALVPVCLVTLTAVLAMLGHFHYKKEVLYSDLPLLR
jgi:hypothetical protein